MTPLNLLATLGPFVLIAYVYHRRRQAADLPLPPGPKKLPLIGNLLDMPTSVQWITFHKWCQELGTLR